MVIIVGGKYTVKTTDKKCAMCKYWNGTQGSTTIEPRLGGSFTVDSTERQKCFKNARVMMSIQNCPKFEPRY